MIWVNKIYEVDGDEIELCFDEYHNLNSLARSFYEEMGYKVRDACQLLSCSMHPQEQLCFRLALRAYKHSLDFGLS